MKGGTRAKSVRDRIAAEVARLYLQALQADASLEAARADVKLAESLLQLAADRRQAGTETRIEETRSKVRSLLLLLKATGMSLDLNLQLDQEQMLRQRDEDAQRTQETQKARRMRALPVALGGMRWLATIWGQGV